jgi:hypothetical protein
LHNDNTAPEAEPPGGVLESVLAKLGGSWGEFVGKLRALDCKPMAVHLEIDSLVYTSAKWPASIGLDLWPRLTALLGPGLEAALVRGDSLGELGIGVIVQVARAAVRDGLLPLVRDVLGSMSCNQLRTTGKGGEVMPAFDRHFAGEYEHLARVALFALVHNLRGPTYGAR